MPQSGQRFEKSCKSLARSKRNRRGRKHELAYVGTSNRRHNGYVCGRAFGRAAWAVLKIPINTRKLRRATNAALQPTRHPLAAAVVTRLTMMRCLLFAVAAAASTITPEQASKLRASATR